MKTKAFLLLCGIASATVGCTMAPRYTRPTAPIPVEWPGGAAYEQSRASMNVPAAPDLNWPEFFADDNLRKVIGLALTHNRDLRLAALNVELARALYRIQRNEILPSVAASADAGKQHSSVDLAQPGQPQTTEQYNVNLGITAWEIDFFGRIRSLNNRALQEYLATDQARRSAQTLLVSSVAATYLALAADRENLALADTTFRTQAATLELVQRQYEAGVVDGLTLNQAQIPVETARREVAYYTQLVAQDENALNLLAGLQVPAELLPSDLERVRPPREISPGMPSEVLLRRPDVLQAENMLKAANANIGAARANFFPRISLTSAVGTASDELSRLFETGTGTWSYEPQAVMPIFDARTWSALKARKVQREMAVTQYEKAIQSAFREVSDALAVCGTVSRQVDAQQALVDVLAQTYRLARSRYENGIDSYLGVLDAQRSLFAAQQGLVSLRLAKVSNNVRLYAVLGGGGDQPGASAAE